MTIVCTPLRNQSAKIGRAFSRRKSKKYQSKSEYYFRSVCSESEHAKTVMKLKPSGYLTKEATGTQILEELRNLRYPIV